VVIRTHFAAAISFGYGKLFRVPRKSPYRAIELQAGGAGAFCAGGPLVPAAKTACGQSVLLYQSPALPGWAKALRRPGCG